MLKEQPHNEDSMAFAKELIKLLEKHDKVRPIEMVAQLSQFAGQCGAHASLLEGYGCDQVMQTVMQNASKNYADVLADALGSVPCDCPRCQERKAKAN